MWDAENRLVRADPATGAPRSGDVKAEYAYDYLGRRVEKRVFMWGDADEDGTLEWDATTDRKFVYDGWNVIMELDGAQSPPAVIRRYTWGLDLSATLQDAGGIGALLGTHDAATGSSYLYFYDANGNVGQVLDLSDGTIAVKYEYDPYGGRTNAPAEGEFDQPFRFSTKYFDAETGFYSYIFRPYGPRLGRWLSRDPIAERGGANLYAYVHNLPTHRVDAVGLEGVLPNPRPDPAPLSGCCGPDIGKSLRQLDAALDAELSKLRKAPCQMAQMCINMIASGGWDVGQLMSLGAAAGVGSSGPDAREFYQPGCSTGTCKGTVQLWGRCYRANEVNYYLWGKLTRACRDSLSSWAVRSSAGQSEHGFQAQAWEIKPECQGVEFTSPWYPRMGYLLPESIFTLDWAQLAVTAHRLLSGDVIPAAPAGQGSTNCRNKWTAAGYNGEYYDTTADCAVGCGVTCCARSYHGQFRAHAGGVLRIPPK